MESLGIVPAPAPLPPPTPEGASSSSAHQADSEETEPRFPDSWDAVMDDWDQEAAALEIAYPLVHDSDEEDVAGNCHG